MTDAYKSLAAAIWEEDAWIELIKLWIVAPERSAVFCTKL